MNLKSLKLLRSGIGLLLGSFAFVSMAMAGAEQDTEQAEKEFARGDLIKAEELWRKAAKQGYAPAQLRLAYYLDKSEQNQEAVEWYRKAAEQGNAQGEYDLGTMYAAGEGVKKDINQARIWIERAALKDFLAAVSAMADAYKNGELGLPVDLEKSMYWQNKFKTLAPPAPASQEKKQDNNKAKEKK